MTQIKNQIDSLTEIINLKEKELEQLKSARDTLKAIEGTDAPKAKASRTSQSQVQTSPSKTSKTLQVNNESRTVTQGNNSIHLTTREFVIFEYLYQNKNKSCNREELIAQFDSEYEMTARNIDVHVFALRRKVKEINVAVETVWGSGYKLVIG